MNFSQIIWKLDNEKEIGDFNTDHVYLVQSILNRFHISPDLADIADSLMENSPLGHKQKPSDGGQYVSALGLRKTVRRLKKAIVLLLNHTRKFDLPLSGSEKAMEQERKELFALIKQYEVSVVNGFKMRIEKGPQAVLGGGGISANTEALLAEAMKEAEAATAEAMAGKAEADAAVAAPADTSSVAANTASAAADTSTAPTTTSSSVGGRRRTRSSKRRRGTRR